jgi:endonuclease YncB( thermonuclease family)
MTKYNYLLRYLLTVVILCLCMAATGWLFGAPPPRGVTTRGVVVNIVDGDTIDFEVRYRVRIRLLDCWVPELNKGPEQERQRGRVAMLYARGLAGGKSATLFVPTQKARSMMDILTLDRVLGHVWLDGFDESLSELMVESGYASKEKPR